MGIESALRHEQWPLLGVGYPTDYPTGQRGGISHHNTAHGPMGTPPEFLPSTNEVTACKAQQHIISKKQSELSRARWLRNIGVGLSMVSGSVALAAGHATRHSESVFNRSDVVFGASLMGIGLGVGTGLYLITLGASRMASIQEGLSYDLSRFERDNCAQVLATAAEASVAHRFEARDLATDFNPTTAMAGMEGRYTPPAPWRKTIAPGAAVVVTTIVAAVAIAEDFFPIAGGPANDAPAITAAAASWRLYLSCF